MSPLLRLIVVHCLVLCVLHVSGAPAPSGNTKTTPSAPAPSGNTKTTPSAPAPAPGGNPAPAPAPGGNPAPAPGPAPANNNGLCYQNDPFNCTGSCKMNTTCYECGFFADTYAGYCHNATKVCETLPLISKGCFNLSAPFCFKVANCTSGYIWNNSVCDCVPACWTVNNTCQYSNCTFDYDKCQCLCPWDSFPSWIVLNQNPAFAIIPLGVHADPFQDDLNAFLFGNLNKTNPQSMPSNFGVFDAGTFLTGLREADDNGIFNMLVLPNNSDANSSYTTVTTTTTVEGGLTITTTLIVTVTSSNNTRNYTRVGYVALVLVKDFFITHQHYDHIVGLIIDSDIFDNRTTKFVYGLNSTIQNLTECAFNWEMWPNEGNMGVLPYLNSYSYKIMIPKLVYYVPNIMFNVTAYPLAHGNAISTAFLAESLIYNNQYLLYVGDTTPDSLSNTKNLQNLWNDVAPLIAQNQLRAMIVECAYPNETPDLLLNGHMKPSLLLKELQNLENAVSKVNNAKTKTIDGLYVFVTHYKPSIWFGNDTRITIANQLWAGNNLGVRFIFPKQGFRYDV